MSKTLKKTLSIILTILMIATTMPFAFAADSGTCGDNVTWTLDSDGLLTISGTGAIDNHSFYDNRNIKTVVIKDGVTSIGDSAFFYCKKLASVTIPNSVTSIGYAAFVYCENLASVTIPNSVTSIGDSAFGECTSLESIEIPDSVTSIGFAAFSDTAYYNNENNWENGVLYIGNHLVSAKNDDISGNYSVKSGTKTIAGDAFAYCTSLESVTIPDSVTSIDEGAFRYCTSLDNITVDEDNEYYSSENGVLFNKDKTTLILYPTGNSRISYTIPDSVTSIGEGAFMYCTSLASVTIPDSVTSIGDYAFNRCTSLASIIIPAGVTSIGDYMFYWCTSLESITIPDSVTSIGEWAFYNCTSLTLVHYFGTSEQWDEIEIDTSETFGPIGVSTSNAALTDATRHYCTEVAATVTCTADGYTAGWYCADCEEYVVGHEETAALGHVDANGDYICDNGCGHEFEKPVAPTPDTPDEPTDNVCKDCGKVHTNFFSEIICFFTRIINYIKNLFA